MFFHRIKHVPVFANNTFTLFMTGPHAQTHSRRATGCWCCPPLRHGNLCRLHSAPVHHPSPLSAPLWSSSSSSWTGNRTSDAMMPFCLWPLLSSPLFFLWPISVGLWPNGNRVLPVSQNPKTPYIKGAGPPHRRVTEEVEKKGLSRNNYSIERKYFLIIFDLSILNGQICCFSLSFMKVNKEFLDCWVEKRGQFEESWGFATILWYFID